MGQKKIDLLQGTLDLIVLRMLRAGPSKGWQHALGLILSTAEEIRC